MKWVVNIVACGLYPAILLLSIGAAVIIGLWVLYGVVSIYGWLGVDLLPPHPRTWGH